jgi:hypothetical protein
MSLLSVLPLTVLILGSGCGSETSGRDGGPSLPPPSQNERSEPALRDPDAFLPTGFAGMDDAGGYFFLTESETAQPAIDDIYRVFARPATNADREAQALARAIVDYGHVTQRSNPPAGVSSEEWEKMHPGRVLHDQGRVVLAGLGAEDDKLYAAPTEHGYLCYALLPNGGGACAPPGPYGLALAWTFLPPRSLMLYGLVGDEVARVELIAARKTHSTDAGENAFAVTLDHVRSTEVSELVLHLIDGSEQRVPMNPASTAADD